MNIVPTEKDPISVEKIITSSIVFLVGILQYLFDFFSPLTKLILALIAVSLIVVINKKLIKIIINLSKKFIFQVERRHLKHVYISKLIKSVEQNIDEK